MQTVTIVEFTRSIGSYRAGERAGFPDERAMRFVAAGVAQPVRTGVPVVEPATAAHDQVQRDTALRAPASASARPLGPDALAQLAELQAQVAALTAQLEGRRRGADKAA